MQDTAPRAVADQSFRLDCGSHDRRGLSIAGAQIAASAGPTICSSCFEQGLGGASATAVLATAITSGG
jgi:hypothetical protein